MHVNKIVKDAKECPWCGRWSLKDFSCNYIFACGLDSVKFHVGFGCGRSWCFQCGLRFCGQYYDPVTGRKMVDAKDSHDALCCKLDKDYAREKFCPGGHNSHCQSRTD